MKIKENREKTGFFIPTLPKRGGVHERATPLEPRQRRSGGASWAGQSSSAPGGLRPPDGLRPGTAGAEKRGVTNLSPLSPPGRFLVLFLFLLSYAYLRDLGCPGPSPDLPFLKRRCAARPGDGGVGPPASLRPPFFRPLGDRGRQGATGSK